MVHPPACAGAERRHLSRGARPRPRPERKICPRLPVRCAASAVTSSDILQYWFMHVLLPLAGPPAGVCVPTPFPCLSPDCPAPAPTTYNPLAVA